MNTSTTPNNEFLLSTSSRAMAVRFAELPLEDPLCNRFGTWLDARLAELDEQFGAFVTRDSLRQSLRSGRGR